MESINLLQSFGLTEDGRLVSVEDVGHPLARYEGFYASVFYSHLAALALDLTAEDATSLGRIDLTLKFNGQVWLFEFKVVEQEPTGRALQQLKDRGYADKYRALGQPIHLIGIEFSREQRTLVGFEVETVGLDHYSGQPRARLRSQGFQP